MKVKRWLLVCLSLLILTGMRDPFLPPEDRCHIPELSMWRYQGAVSRGERVIGFVQDGNHRWWRVEKHNVLNSNWVISEVLTQSLTIDTGKECEPSRWQWQRQGEVNEAMDSNRADGRYTGRAGGESAKRDTGG